MYAAGLAAVPRDPGGTRRSRANSGRRRRRDRAGDAETITDINTRFHDRILALAGNTLLISVMEPVAGRLRWLTRRNEEWPQLLIEHRELYDAIASGDPDRARAHALSTRPGQLPLHGAAAVRTIGNTARLNSPDPSKAVRPDSRDPLKADRPASLPHCPPGVTVRRRHQRLRHAPRSRTVSGVVDDDQLAAGPGVMKPPHDAEKVPEVETALHEGAGAYP